MRHETAGDPMTGLKWTRRTTEKIAEQLREIGIRVCANTVCKLLRQMGYALRVNHKKLTASSPSDRDEQFAYIANRRETFAQRGLPIVSIDTKKKELIGNFKNAGSAWQREPVLVRDHDFRSDAEGSPFRTESTTSRRISDPSSSGPATTPPSSPSTISRGGGVTTVDDAIEDRRNS